jgi:hypothetical protein
LSQELTIMKKGTPQLIASVLGLLIVAHASSPAKTIRFAGYVWAVKSGTHEGPGPNNWNDNNVWVDQGGYLHLRLTKQGEGWYCAEIFTKDRLSFGRYRSGLWDAWTARSQRRVRIIQLPDPMSDRMARTRLTSSSPSGAGQRLQWATMPSGRRARGSAALASGSPSSYRPNTPRTGLSGEHTQL